MEKWSKEWIDDAVKKAGEALRNKDERPMTLEEQIEDDAEYGYFDDACDYDPPEPIELTPHKITSKLFNGMRFCFVNNHDYDNYCVFYHVDRAIYRVNLSDERVTRKLAGIFPALNEIQHAKTNKVGAWYWQYLGGACVLFVHEDVIDAYKNNLGIEGEPLDWQPDEAWQTILDLPHEDYQPKKLDSKKLSELQNLWVYLGNDSERYVLGQPGDKNLLVFGVNPSTAKPGDDDPTIKRVRKITRDRGYDGWIMVNLHPQRTKNPDELRENEIWRENNLLALDAVKRFFHIEAIWCAWGDSIDKPGKQFLYRSLREIYDLLKGGSASWLRYGELTGKGHPWHPLHAPVKGKFNSFKIEEYLLTHEETAH